MVLNEPKRAAGAIRLRFSWHVTLWLGIAVAVAAGTVGLLWLLLGRPALVSEPLDAAAIFDMAKIGLAVAAGIGGVIALVVAYRRQHLAEVGHLRQEADHALREQAASREETRLFNERFDRATSKLESANAAGRLTGVYAIAGLADDWSAGRQTCIDVLCAYLRMPATQPRPAAGGPAGAAAGTSPPGDTYPVHERHIRLTITRVITARLRDGANASWQGHDFDFTGATLHEGDFRAAHFAGGSACFNGVRFPSGTVSFAGARFSGGTVGFVDATFSGGVVSFSGATFSGGTVEFREARFAGGTVTFDRARFAGGLVSLNRAELSGGTVDLHGAEFAGGTVAFLGATLSGAKVTFRGAVVSGGTLDFRGSRFAGSEVDVSQVELTGGSVVLRRAVVSGGRVHFNHATFARGRVDFRNATFAGGRVNFRGAAFSGSRVDFRNAEFQGGSVDVSEPGSWTRPATFDAFDGTVPAGLLLPAEP